MEASEAMTKSAHLKHCGCWNVTMADQLAMRYSSSIADGIEERRGEEKVERQLEL